MSTGIIGPDKAMGDLINLKISSKRHFADDGKMGEPEKADTSFSSMLMNSLDDVNDKQVYFEDLSTKAITDPSSVEAHDVTIAMAEASMSLNIAKNVLDRVLRSWQTITSLR